MKQQPKDYIEDLISADIKAGRHRPTRSRQSKLESAIEISVNIASGFIVSYLVWLFIVPVFWPELASSYKTAFWLTALFTVSSVIRSYLWRRFFEREFHKAVHSFIKGN